MPGNSSYRSHAVGVEKSLHKHLFLETCLALLLQTPNERDREHIAPDPSLAQYLLLSDY